MCRVHPFTMSLIGLSRVVCALYTLGIPHVHFKGIAQLQMAPVKYEHSCSLVYLM